MGRTGLAVTRMGLGCGGYSRLGIRNGASESEAVAVVRKALELGINLIDTAESYQNEGVVGKAIDGQRDEVILATKSGSHWEGKLKTSAMVEASIDQSLRNLRTDRIDIYQIHAVTPDVYDDVVDRIYPVLTEMKAKGKIRFIGITEMFEGDLVHGMLSRAVLDDYWDTMMVGFNLLNQTAREKVLSPLQEKDVGVMCMFPVRYSLTTSERLISVLSRLVETGQLAAEEFDSENPLTFLNGKDISSLTDVAYRFCRDEPGIDTVLCGTGNVDHLEENYRSLEAPELDAGTREKIKQLFRNVDSVSGGRI